jgi:hypothetical protein
VFVALVVINKSSFNTFNLFFYSYWFKTFPITIFFTHVRYNTILMEQLKSWKTRFGRFSKSTKVGVLCTWACPKVFGPTLVPTALGLTTRRIKTKEDLDNLMSIKFSEEIQRSAWNDESNKNFIIVVLIIINYPKLSSYSKLISELFLKQIKSRRATLND